LEILEKIPDEECALIFDGMSIRQQLCWSQTENKFVGYCDYGNDLNFEKKETEAKEVLVFMLVNLKGKWKWLIAYFLKSKMSSIVLAELIKSINVNNTNKIKNKICNMRW